MDHQVVQHLFLMKPELAKEKGMKFKNRFLTKKWVFSVYFSILTPNIPDAAYIRLIWSFFFPKIGIKFKMKFLKSDNVVS